MSIRTPKEVPEPNLFDPTFLDAIETPIPDFYVVFNHPTRPDEEYHIPCRELDPGESLVFMMAVREKYPEMPDVNVSDLPEAERQQFYENQKVIDGLDNELFTDIAVCVFLQDGWTRSRVEKLPKSTRRAAYQGATAGLNVENPAVDTFPEKSAKGVSPNENVVLSSPPSESERSGTASEDVVSERAESASAMEN